LYSTLECTLLEWTVILTMRPVLIVRKAFNSIQSLVSESLTQAYVWSLPCRRIQAHASTRARCHSTLGVIPTRTQSYDIGGAAG
jgi:hypothetical protein